MPIPSTIDEQIRKRLESLKTESDQLISHAEASATQSRPTGIPSGLMRDKIQLSGSQFDTLKTKLLTLLQFLAGSPSVSSTYIAKMIEDVRQLTNTLSGVYSLVGTIAGIKDDYESGMFINLAEVIEAQVTSDYLTQAEMLLSEAQTGQFDQVPAAVLTGAVLEDALRRLCQRQSPPVDTVKPNGSPKTLSALIDDLKGAGLYNELKAKQLRAWTDIRNSAAHGHFNAFSRQDVEQMLVGVQNFLAEFMS